MTCCRRVVLSFLLAALAGGAGCSDSSGPDRSRSDAGSGSETRSPESPGFSAAVRPGEMRESPEAPGFRDSGAIAAEGGSSAGFPEPRRIPSEVREASRGEVSRTPGEGPAASEALPARRPGSPDGEAGRRELAREVGGYLDALQREAVEEAARLGFPVRTHDAEGRPLELIAIRDSQPVYRTTFNATAAVAARVVPLHESPRRGTDFDLSGEGVTVGVWDQARVLDFHREFDPGQVTNHYAEPLYSHHATHVAGTIGARGAENEAKGMAPEARIDGYNWDQALAEMLGRAPLYPGEPGSLALANHSYGLVAGWFFLGEEEAFVFTGFDRFGRYDEFAYLTDLVAHASPYQLSVWAAGNHRSGDPAPGDPVRIDGETVSYDPEIHPPGDGDYKRGFDTVNSFQIAKNVLTVGAVDFSSAGEGALDLSEARMTGFSSWGSTDDGRVKPDLVTHAVGLFSPIAIDGWYGRASGTSMAAPVVTGSLALLIEKYGDRFPGHALRASTLKALLVHTADDLGNPGPDARHGWGLMNASAAAEILADYGESPRPGLLAEHRLSDDRPTASYPVEATGDGPLRVTLAWTDPPAAGPVEGPDDRTPTLINNLHLRVIAPGGETTRHPYRLDPEAPAAPATTGINDVDNVLRVDVASPDREGAYTVEIDSEGALFGGEQVYSLVVTGAENTFSPASAPSVSAVHPSGAPNSRTAVLEVSGAGFLLGTDLRLSRSGEEPIDAFGVEANGERIRARFDLYGAAPGAWDLEVRSPDGGIAEVREAFEVEPDCFFAIDPDTAGISASGGFFSARLETSLEDCEWTLASTEDWLLFLTPTTGTGDAEVIYSVGAHSGSAVPRSAAIEVNGETLLSVEQEGVAPVTLRDRAARAGFVTGRDRQSDWKYYRFEVPNITAGKVEFLLEGLTGDADLYVRHGEKPTLDDFDCRPALGGLQAELCEFADPEPGTWWIGVNNWDTGRIDYMISASLFVETLTYDDWVSNSFDPDDAADPAIAAPGADPGDFGISNMLRYALAMDPHRPDRENLPRVGVTEDEGDEYLYIEYTRRIATTDTDFLVEVSSDLEEWDTLDGTVETVAENTTTRTVRVRQTEPISSGTARFLRLRVTMD